MKQLKHAMESDGFDHIGLSSSFLDWEQSLRDVFTLMTYTWVHVHVCTQTGACL